jgi:3-hydroxyisobutyrate dehydrogenase
VSRIGFIGLGNMGFPMAGRLAAAGHALVVSDVASEVVDRFILEHPTTAQRVSDVGWSGCSAIITMLPNSAIVEKALVAGGVLDAADPNALIIDMSSAEPVRSRNLGQRVIAGGLRYLDAPVSGGVRGAVNGALAIMVGGRDEDLAEARVWFEVLGRSIVHVGGVGTGHAAKALNNVVSAASVIATVEALRVGEAFGIDPSILVDVLNSSSGRSNTSENKAKQFMLSGAFNSGFPIGLMTKDIRIAAALADELDIETPLADRNRELWERACQAGHAEADHTELYRIDLAQATAENETHGDTDDAR